MGNIIQGSRIGWGFAVVDEVAVAELVVEFVQDGLEIEERFGVFWEEGNGDIGDAIAQIKCV
jgi:hypothetical protein